MQAPQSGRIHASADVGHDGFAAALINGLHQPPDERQTWGATRTIFWSVITLGIGPAVLWAMRFADTARAERDLFTRLADWMRFHSIHTEAGMLRNAEAELAPRTFLSAMPVLMCGAVVAVFALAASKYSLDIGDILNRTYWYRFRWPRIERVIADPRAQLFFIWNGGLALAYLAHLVQVRLHHADVARYLTRVNRVLMAEGLAPVSVIEPPPRRWVRWVLASALLAFYLNAWWAVAAMLAAAAQNRYTAYTSPVARRALAARVTEMLQARGPGACVSRCHRERCRAPLPLGARFCRRCGVAARDPIAVVA